MIEKKDIQSTSVFFVDLTGSNKLLGSPQYEAKDITNPFFVAQYSWDFAVAPRGHSGLRFYIFSRTVADNPVSLWIYDLVPNGESERAFACVNLVIM